MRRAIMLSEAVATRFEEALECHRRGRLSSAEAGEALGMTDLFIERGPSERIRSDQGPEFIAMVR